MKSFIALAIISMVSMARAGTILGGPLTTTSLVSPLATSLHQPTLLSSPLIGGVVASSSWGGSPLLTRTVSNHGVWGSPWVGSSALVAHAQPTLVHGGLIGAHNVW